MVRPSVDTAVILDAAADLVAEAGWDRVTTDAIAGRAGVAKGVLYLRYPSKDELLAAVLRRELGLAARRTVELVQPDPRGGMLSRLFVHSLAALRSRPALFRFYREEPPRLTGLLTEYDGPRAWVLSSARFLRELQDHGLVRSSLDPDVLATNLALWNYGLAARAPYEDLDALVAGMGELVARAADTDAVDSAHGKRCFARLADAMEAEGVPR